MQCGTGSILRAGSVTLIQENNRDGFHPSVSCKSWLGSLRSLAYWSSLAVESARVGGFGRSSRL